MVVTKIPLLASYFTFAGNIVPLRDLGPCPFDFRTRVEAAAKAGFTGFGLFFTDLPAVIDRYGYSGMRAILADNGITRLELEALIDWFADGERGAAAAESRALLLRSSEALGAYHVKAAGDLAASFSSTPKIKFRGRAATFPKSIPPRTICQTSSISPPLTLPASSTIVSARSSEATFEKATISMLIRDPRAAASSHSFAKLSVIRSIGQSLVKSPAALT